MQRFLFAACAALALTACQTTPSGPTATVDLGAAPLANTSVDNKGITFALTAASTISKLVNIARDSGKLVPGTPKAKEVAGYLRDLAKALRGASAGQRALDTGKVELNLDEATRLVAAIQAAL